MNLSKKLVLSLYRKMLEIRRFEEKVQELYRRGVLPGFVHLYIGEEAVAVGVCARLRPNDYVVSTHRGHGHALAKGCLPQSLLAELWGKETGCCRGRGGSMHLFQPGIGFLGTNGFVAAGIPMGVGAAYSAGLRKTGQVSVVFFGDGAVNHGAFHEGLNLAALWDLPVIFVCENNLYATETPFREASKVTDLAQKAAAYGIPEITLDGNDVSAVYESAGRAIDQARNGKGPSLLECQTYRTVGHHEGDPGIGYRTREEVEEWKRRCPLLRFRQRLLEEKMIPGKVLAKIEQETETLITQAAQFAESSPIPSTEEVLEGVFSTT